RRRRRQPRVLVRPLLRDRAPQRAHVRLPRIDRLRLPSGDGRVGRCARPSRSRPRVRSPMTRLTERQAELCERSTTDYSDLKAYFINCTLKRSPERSHTQGLMDVSMEIMRRNEVEVDGIRAVDNDIATGVWPDMTEHGW